VWQSACCGKLEGTGREDGWLKRGAAMSPSSSIEGGRDQRAWVEGVMATIDVVIPCYRYGRYLRHCAESVLAQPVDDIRVLVLDDCSDDETAEVGVRLAAEDRRVTFRRHAANRGHIATYNEGIAWSSGAYFLLLSADDFLLAGTFARALGLLDADPSVGFVFGRCIQLRPDEEMPQLEPDGGGSRTVDGCEFVRLSGARNIVETPTAIVRGDLQRRVGGYRPDLPHAADMEMWLRLAKHGRIGIIDAAQGVRRIHDSNMSRNYADSLSDLAQRKLILDELFSAADRPAGIDRLREPICAALADDAVMVAANAFRRGEIVACKEILELAELVHPAVRRTGAWRMLAVKRRLGYRLSSALRPVVAKMRHSATRGRLPPPSQLPERATIGSPRS
jgi:GT2 family glycosyltransferase